MIRKYRLTVFTILFFLVSYVLAGAGGTSGSDDGGGIFIILLIVLFLPYLVGHGFYLFLIRKKAKKDAWKVFNSAVKSNDIWDEENLIGVAEGMFIRMQNLWSQNDLENSKMHLHPLYTRKYSSLLENNIQAGRYNRISNINITQTSVVLAQNYLDDSKDMFVAHIEGSMNDEMIDEQGNVINTQGDKKGKSKRSINEYWYFQRQGDKWLLKNITKKHTSLLDISFDEENLPRTRKEMREIDPDFERFLESTRINKRLYIAMAVALGLVIAVVGYAFYFWIGLAIYRAIF